MNDWIRESNLIEDVDDPLEDTRSQRAWDWVKDRPLTVQNILGLHKRIMRLHLGPDAGRFRTCRVWVGGREGLLWPQIPEAMARWVRAYAKMIFKHTDATIQYAHVEFERIHPFIDGNGRTGRMVMNWQRRRAGLEPLCIMASERMAYYYWFKEF